jgi:hypothetical protein
MKARTLSGTDVPVVGDGECVGGVVGFRECLAVGFGCGVRGTGAGARAGLREGLVEGVGLAVTGAWAAVLVDPAVPPPEVAATATVAAAPTVTAIAAPVAQWTLCPPMCRRNARCRRIGPVALRWAF